MHLTLSIGSRPFTNNGTGVAANKQKLESICLMQRMPTAPKLLLCQKLTNPSQITHEADLSLGRNDETG
jgi:hypothetical protein